MAQQLQVNLSFTADANKAKAQIESLQSSLNKLMTMKPPTGLNTTTESILEAQKAAAQLAVSLKNATDVNTGKLNLTSFSQELTKSKMSLEDYRIQLSNLGPEGQKTFANLAKSVMTADSAFKNTNTLVNNLWVSLKNTARWQLSSSMIKGFMSAFSGAFSYAQDLNESLNRIQIVTGNSADEMARFAVQANKAAKELSTTTTAYTDASLIYYQQGLDDESVKARTDLTIKAANAAGTNAAEMADYLTAVWNSYKVGTDDLERYVDIMAALGAGTATSLEEISTSMEKVASVGEATGVRFEQMASIIATVSSVTRQSAESVGTAFKTIFARMADLKLNGSVEEDGVTTDLGTVSKQLDQIGINILDANGDLRDMGDVMEELMSKWNGMNEATQQAVAIALAGKRQYTQLLALMNNQDLYQQSMNIAGGSEGTLEQQAETYAQSWEAAQKRVKAAAQGIFDSLINDKFFIKMNDGLAGVLGLIENLIDSMGGFGGVLGGVGTLVFTLFEDNINKALEKTITSIYSTSRAGKEAAQVLRETASTQLELMYQVESSGNLNTYEKTDLTIQRERLKLEEQLAAYARDMTEDEIKLAQHALDTNKAYAERALSSAKQVANLEEEFRLLREEAEGSVVSVVPMTGSAEQVLKNEKAQLDALNDAMEKLKANSSDVQNVLSAGLANTDITELNTKGLRTWLSDLKSANPYVQELQTRVKELGRELGTHNITTEEYNTRLSAIKREIREVANGTGAAEKEFIAMGQSLGLTNEQATALARLLPQMASAEKNAQQTMEQFNASCQSFITSVGNFNQNAIQVFTKNFTGMLRGISSLTMGISSLKSAWDTLNNQDMSTFDKILSIFTSLSMGLPMLITGLTSLKDTLVGVGKGFATAITNEVEAIVRKTAMTAATAAETAAHKANTEAIGEETAAKTAQKALDEQLTIIKGMSLKSQLTYVAAQKLGVETTLEQVAANSSKVAGDIAAKISTDSLTTSQTLLGAAVMFVNKQFGTGFKLLGTIAIPLAALVATIWGLVKVFEVVNETSPEKTLQKAQEAAQEAATTFDEASTAVDNLKTSLDGLEESHKNIETLTRGTREYIDAINEANEKALDLLSTNAQLASGMTNKNGIITFTEESQQAAIRAAQTRSDVAYAAKIKADQNLYDKRFDYEVSNTAENLTQKYGMVIDSNKYTSSQDYVESLVNDYLSQGEFLFDSTNGRIAEHANDANNLKIISSNEELQNEIRVLAGIMQEANALEESANSLMAQQIANQAGITDDKLIAGLDYGAASTYGKNKAQQVMGLDWNDRKNYDSNDQIVKDVIDALYGTGNASYVAQRSGSMVLSVDGEEKSYTQEQVKQILESYYADDNIRQQIADSLINNFNTIFTNVQIDQDTLKQLTNDQQSALANNQDVLKGVATLGGDTAKLNDVNNLKALADALNNGGTTEEILKLGEAIGISNNNLENFVDLIQSSSSALSDLPGLTSLITSLKQGNELTDEQNTLIEKLKERYPELANVADVTSKEFIDSLVDIQQNLERIDIQKLIDKNKDIDLDLEIDTNSEEVEDEVHQMVANLDEFLSNDLAIELNIKNNIDSDIQNMVDDVNNLKGVIESISDSWQISADDIDTLAAAFPGILENYTILANGMIQLDGEVAQNAINDANTEVKTNGEAAIRKMQQEKTFLQQKADAYNKIAAGLEMLAEGEALSVGESAEAKKKIEEGLTEVKQIEDQQRASNAANEGTSEQNTSTEVVNALEEDNQTMSQNAANAYGAMALASQQYADAAIKNAQLVAEAMKKAAKGDTSKVGATTSGNVTNSYKSEKAAQKAELKASYEEAVKEKDIGSLIAYALEGSTDAAAQGAKIARQMAQSMLDGIGAYDVGIAKMEALMQETEYVVENARNGGTNNDDNNSGNSGGGGSNSGDGGNSGKSDTDSGSTKSDSGSTETPKEEYEDPLRIQDEVDRYQDIDMELTRQERILDRIKDSQDDLYGKDYFAALDKEKAALEEQNALLEKKNEEIQKYNETDIKTLTDLGLTPEFDDQGNIINIEELQAQITELRNQASREATDAKNAAHAAYDAAVNGENASWDATVNGYTDDEGSPEKDAAEEAHDNRIDALEEEHDVEIKSIEDIEEKKQQSYDDAWDAIQNYNDGIDTVFENDMQKEENLRRMREINFEETMKVLEIIDDLTQRQIRQIDNLRRRFRNGLFGLADNTDADNAEIGDLLNNLNKVGEQKAKLDAQFASGEISESQYYEGLGDIDDQADELYNSIYDLSDAIGERFIEALDEADDRMDESIGKFDHLKNVVSSIENLTKLTYGEEDYDRMDTLYRDMVDITENEYEYNKQMWQQRKSEYEEAKRLYEESVATGKNQKIIDQLEEHMRAVEDSMNDWHERMYDSAEEFAEAINNVYTNTINQTMDELEKQLTSGQGFDKLQEQLERLKDYDDDYLTGVNQKYETQRLIRTALTDMDKTQSQAAKNRLDGFIKETQELQKQQRLSKYELGIQERKYQVLLAELALQDAQDAKSQVRLQRDSEGNFNYVYTADQDAILGAQEEYEKAKNDLYNYIREESVNIQEEILQNDMDYWEKVNEIASDATMSREEKLRELDELEAYHAQRQLDLNEQLNAGREASNQAYQDSYALQVYDEIATVGEMKDAHEVATDKIIDATKELEQNTKTYTNQMRTDINSVGSTINEYANTVETDMKRTTDALDIVQGQTANWAGTMSGLLDLVASRYYNITAACQQAMATISGFMPDIDYFNAFYNSETYDEVFTNGTTREYMVQNKIGGKGKYLANTKGGLNMSWEGENMDMAEIIINADDQDYDKIADAVMFREGKINTSGDFYNNVGSTRALLEAKYGNNIPEELLKAIRERNVPGFDTGGYTGDFGPEARIGLLHEKELVLNQADTQNLLDSIELVDRLLNNLEYQNLIHDFDMVNWGQQVSGTGTLEQEVTIRAEFPNVQDRNEIELAITNLTNTAAQYANKRKR